jgi:hypothetical protein
MREESLRLAPAICQPLENPLCDEEYYHVESTGAVVTLNSSVPLIYLFCSKLPSDESVFFLRQGFLFLHIENAFSGSKNSNGSNFYLPDILNLDQDSLLTRHWVPAPCIFPRAVLCRQFMQKEKVLSSNRLLVSRLARSYMLLVLSQIISCQN